MCELNKKANEVADGKQNMELEVVCAGDMDVAEPETLTGDVVNAVSAEQLVASIEDDLNHVNSKQFDIARKFYQMYAQNLYRDLKYDNIYDLAKDKFEFSKGRTNEYINVCKNFGVIEDELCTGLKPEYSGYSISKLVALNNVPKNLLPEFTPEMSVRAIKERKKELTPSTKKKDTEKPETRRLTADDFYKDDFWDELRYKLMSKCPDIFEKYKDSDGYKIEILIEY